MSFLDDYVTPESLNKALGYGTYGVVTYQFLQTALFGSSLPNSYWLSTFFPYSVDDQSPASPALWNWQLRHPLFSNVLLLTFFGLQHSLQSRLWVQSGLKRSLTPWLERLLFVAGSGIAFSMIMSFWQPMTYPVFWDFSNNALGKAMNGLQYAGLAWVLITLWYDAVYDLFDFRKNFGDTTATLGVPDYLPPVYRASRAPLFSGLVLCFWATPIMTAGHFLFASLMTLYTITGIQYQERDKLARLGAKYAEYQRRVPLLVPSITTLFNEDSTITVPGAVAEKMIDVQKKVEERPFGVSPIDVHRYQHVGAR